jgi:hypothetical protein
MRLITGRVDIPSAGTRVQISSVKEKVRWIRFSSVFGNSAGIYFGDVTVSATAGKELRPPEDSEIHGLESQSELRPWVDGAGTIFLSDLYADADTNGDDIEYEALVV